MVIEGRLLVAERDPELLELIVPVLRLAGHRVTAARDGLQPSGCGATSPSTSS